MQLKDYSLAVIASHNVVGFLNILLGSLCLLNFDFSKLYLGNAGLKDKDIAKLNNKINIISLHNKNQNKFRTQSLDYRCVIDNRVQFLREVNSITNGSPILQLDADTYVVKDDFCLIDDEVDIVLTVRDVSKGRQNSITKRFKKHTKQYPNLGVVFWNKPNNCIEVWDEWERLRNTVSPDGSQYEQNIFFHMMDTRAFNNVSVQKIYCYHYNSYVIGWLKEYGSSIVHFKGGSARDKSQRKPNPCWAEFLKI